MTQPKGRSVSEASSRSESTVPAQEENEVSNNKVAWRSFWLIAARAHARLEVLTIDASGETVLPVFSFQEEGESFLHSEALVADWWPRETTAGELVSLLLGLCARVDKVALDPLPGLREEITGLVSIGRRDYVRRLMGEVAAHSEMRLYLQPPNEVER
jgi:hypothetical protein